MSSKNDVNRRVEVAEQQHHFKRLGQVQNWILRVETVLKSIKLSRMVRKKLRSCAVGVTVQRATYPATNLRMKCQNVGGTLL